jgi:hypothetical protein
MSPDAPSAAAAARDALAERVAAAVAAHPSVAGFHGGRYNDVATYVATGRLVGVRIGGPDEPVEIGVVLRLDRPIPDVVAELRSSVSALCGGVRVDITVGDVDTGEEDTTGVGVATPPAAPDPGRMVR